MKLRIKGDSIRIRLSKSEVDHFTQNGKYEAYTHFPNGKSFEYGLQVSNKCDSLTAELTEKGMLLCMPRNWADEWLTTQKVGFESRISLPQGGELYLLLEKDFQCLDANTEDQSDMYPNPLAENYK
ncbi:MAG: hypothetical protein GC180_07980 [Bacteroidetes bacterium]|nr:hypothetical protein [Bacteroidota bacterium]